MPRHSPTPASPHNSVSCSVNVGRCKRLPLHPSHMGGIHRDSLRRVTAPRQTAATIWRDLTSTGCSTALRQCVCRVRLNPLKVELAKRVFSSSSHTKHAIHLFVAAHTHAHADTKHNSNEPVMHQPCSTLMFRRVKRTFLPIPTAPFLPFRTVILQST